MLVLCVAGLRGTIGFRLSGTQNVENKVFGASLYLFQCNTARAVRGGPQSINQPLFWMAIATSADKAAATSTLIRRASLLCTTP
jgi:hypothetical protein